MISTKKPWRSRLIPTPAITPSIAQPIRLKKHHRQPQKQCRIYGYRWLLPTLVMVGTCCASVFMPMAAQEIELDEFSQWTSNNQRDTSEPTSEPLTPQSHQCTAALTTAIAPIISQPTFANGNWGMVIASLDTGERLYHHNANQYFVPASNVKLLTTAAALARLEFSTTDLLTAFYDWVGVTNRNSNNQYADALLRRLGGPDTVKSTLEPLGVNPNNYRQVDGSGLSRYNMAKPTVFIEILMAMTNIPREAVFYNSLPVAGQSGTLRNRFKNTAAQGIVRAKTGTLRGVRALSGYMEHPTEGRMVFSIMVNQPGQSGWTMINAIDRVVVAIATTDCP